MKRQIAGVENKRAELGDEMNPTETGKRARPISSLIPTCNTP